MDNEQAVKITYYINPHMFWFKCKSKCRENELSLWEEKFLSHNVSASSYQPEIDEIVAVYASRVNYWIRAKCDHILLREGRKHYNLWGIDVGIPLQVEDTYIRQLPQELQEEVYEAVCFAGLENIVPAHKIYNLEKLETEIKYSKKWSSVAVETMRKLIQDAHETVFVHTKDSTNGQLFGNLILTTQSDIKIRADKILLDLDQATILPACDFFKTLDIIATNKMPRWPTSNDELNNLQEFYIKWSSLQENQTSEFEVKYHLNENSENDCMEQCINKKCLDWEEKNKIYRHQEKINIQELSIIDKISDQNFFFDDPPIKAGALRRRCLKKYQCTIPPPPFVKNLLALTDLSCENSQFQSKEADNKSLSRAITDGSKNYSCNNAVKVLMDRRYEKRKNFTTKFKSSLPPKEQGIPTNPIEESNDVAVVQPNYDEWNLLKPLDSRDTRSNFIYVSKQTTNNEASVLKSYVKLESSTPHRRYVKKKDEERIFPAGFDLRNLTKNRGLNKNTTKNHSKIMETSMQIEKKLNSMNSAIRGIQDLKVTQRPNKNSDCNDEFRNDKMALLNNSQTKHLSNFDETCIQANFTNHLVLVHGKHVAKPIEKLRSANFCEEIHLELENMRLNQIYRIQAHTWPHIMRGNSSVVISSARTGKTLSYLPAICSLIKMEEDDSKVPDDIGPIAIIITCSAVEVEKISKLCRRFFTKSRSMCTVVESYGLRNTDKTIRNLLNGCNILIATLPSLNRLVTKEIQLFNARRLRHLVIDDIDFKQAEVKKTLDHIMKIFYCDKTTTNLQLIVISKYWSGFLSRFFKIGLNTQVCIGAYIEAAVYAHTQIKLKLIKGDTKPQEVIKFILEHPYLTNRIAVVCNTDEEVEEITEILKINSFFHIACSSRSTSEQISICLFLFEDIMTIYHRRQKGDMSILVCTDDILPELKITQAKNLIHYSLPHSWTKFSFRFSTLFSSLGDLVKSNNNNKITIRREEERIYENRNFCSLLLEFGKCCDVDCPFRHELTKHDAPRNNSFKNGNIIFQLLKVISPTHFTVRILKHQPIECNTWNEVGSSIGYLKWNIRFMEYFSCAENHQLYWPIEINDLCVAFEGGTFYRGQILTVIKRTLDALCKVKLIDVGYVITCKSSDLLNLPEEFREVPHQAVNLRLSGIIPFDNELMWSFNAIQTVQFWFRKHSSDNFKVMASINFSLMDTIWIHNVKIVEKLESIQTFVTVVDIKKSLLEKFFGIRSGEAEEILRKKALGCGLLINDQNTITREYCKMPSNNFPTENFPLVENPVEELKESWEKLLEYQFCRVIIGAFYSPNCFYVQRSLDLDRKELLYLAIDEFVEHHRNIVSNPKIGLNCLAVFNDKYNRAKITKVVCDSQKSEIIVSLFFCDIGASNTIQLSHVLHSSKKLVNMLPFQAIRCKMSGLTSATNGIWTEDVCDRIYDEVLRPAQYIYARSEGILTRSETSILNYWCCEVILMDFTTEKDVNLNDRIVELGFACSDTRSLRLEITGAQPRNYHKSENDKYDSFHTGTSEILDLSKEIDVQFSNQDIFNLLKTPRATKLKTQPKKDSILQKSKVNHFHPETYFEGRKHSENNSCQTNFMPNLKGGCKRPDVFWQQSDSHISIRIVAPDVDDYFLKISSSNLVFIGCIQSEIKILILNFCGRVNSFITAHHIRGLEILLRIPKEIKGIQWPRLSAASDRFNWLRYNHDSIYVEQVDRGIPAQSALDVVLDGSASDVYSEMEHEFNIPAFNDMFDPFDDEFT